MKNLGYLPALDGRDDRYFTCSSKSAKPRQLRLTGHPSIIHAIHLSDTPLQRQFSLLQPLQRLPPRNNILPELWPRRKRPSAHSPTFPPGNKTAQPVLFPTPRTLSRAYCRFDTQDGLYDCAWSEVHENQLVTASGDGSIKLFDITLKVWLLGKRGLMR